MFRNWHSALKGQVGVLMNKKISRVTEKLR